MRNVVKVTKSMARYGPINFNFNLKSQISFNITTVL
jgi:hypothetical protein